LRLWADIGWMAGLLFFVGAAAAGQFETPPSVSASAALGPAAKGVNYEVLSPVASDGMLRHYVVRTAAGDFETVGDELMLLRVRELSALAQLEKTNAPSKFGKAVMDAGLGPLAFAGSMIEHPIDTTQNTISGIGQMVGDMRSSLDNMGQSRDDAVASLIGEAKEKRALAAEVGVDPYTDFKPLADRLDQLAGASVAGNLAVSGAMIAVPGAAGLAVSNASTANSLRGMAADYSSAQLMDINRAKLARLQVALGVAGQLFANPYYTPLDVSAMADALGKLGPVANLSAMVSAAGSADSRAAAYFVRRRIELTAAWQARHEEIVAFLEPDSVRFPLCQTASGAIVGVYPIDILAWTPETAVTVEAWTAEASRDGVKHKRLFITGTATALAKKNLAAEGWTLGRIQ